MKRLCTLAIFLGIALTGVAQSLQSAADSARRAFLDEIGKELPALSLLPVDSIVSITDRVIAMMDTKEDSTDMAGLFFDYFMDCPVMGTEAVAVHIADNYFLNGKLKWPDESSYPELFAFAEFNRSSLIGRSAPALVLNAIDSSIVDMRAVRSPHKVLYFYEDGCATCVRQTPLLVSLMNAYDGEGQIAFFAIYTQSERSQWESYVAQNFDRIDNPKVTVYNLWDPDYESNFQMNYGVLTTPALFLLDSENMIVGRKLDSDALGQLIDIKDDFRSSLIRLLDTVTDELGANEESAMQLIASLYQRSDGDVETFKTTLYEIFKYFRNIPLRDAQQAASSIAENFILGVDGGWAGETLEEVRWNLEKMQQNSVGATATDETLLNRRGARKRMLAGRKPYTVLFFNIAHCNDCRQYTEDLNAAADLLKARKAKVVSVYLSADKDYWQDNIKANKCWKHLTDEGPASQLREDYDLAVVPRIYLLDKDKKVIAKDITVKTLCDILENNEQ
ncbi:MAG: redoxin domain-containing protein [Bacteroidales bacterium]|nr:redoxin domain-containing protein [Bacteroidales bacterium]